MSNHAYYEHPLNERTRNLLRLEFLCQQFHSAAAVNAEWSIRTALMTLFDVLDFVSRNDFKTELLRELERQRTTLQRHKTTPGVNNSALETLLDTIQQMIAQVQGFHNNVLESIRQHEFLGTIRQRSSIPGSTCGFDLPNLQRWLQHSEIDHKRQLQIWFQPFLILQQGAQLVLQLVRGSATPQPEIAHQGFFEKPLDSTAPNQLIQVLLPLDSSVFPEISAGKHRLSIRFLEASNLSERAQKTQQDVTFQLVCCAI